MSTLLEIETAANAARLQMAEYIKPRLAAARILLQSEEATNLVTAFAALRDELPASEDRVQAGNVAQVLGALVSYFETREATVDAEIAALSPPPAPGVEDSGQF